MAAVAVFEDVAALATAARSPATARGPRPRRRIQPRPLPLRLEQAVRSFPGSRAGPRIPRRNLPGRHQQTGRVLLDVRSQALPDADQDHRRGSGGVGAGAEATASWRFGKGVIR